MLRDAEISGNINIRAKGERKIVDNHEAPLQKPTQVQVPIQATMRSRSPYIVGMFLLISVIIYLVSVNNFSPNLPFISSPLRASVRVNMLSMEIDNNEDFDLNNPQITINKTYTYNPTELKRGQTSILLLKFTDTQGKRTFHLTPCWCGC